MDCSLPSSSIHGIFQARVLEWVAISFSRVSFRPRDQTEVSHIVSKMLYHLSHQGSHAYIWNFERWYRWPYMWDSKRRIDTKNRLLDSVGEGEGGMILEDSIKTCMLPYVKWSLVQVWGMALKAGALGQPWGMGWGGRSEGRSGWGTHVHPCLIHVNVWQKPLQYCKVISLQLKLNLLKTPPPPQQSYFWLKF